MNKEIFIVYFTHQGGVEEVYAFESKEKVYVDPDIPLPEGLPEWIKLY